MPDENGRECPTRILPNGDRLDVIRTLTGNGRLTFTFAATPFPDLQYDGCWCYPSVPEAIVALATWDGSGDPPVGWFREVHAPYRRRPDGDPTREYTAP